MAALRQIPRAIGRWVRPQDFAWLLLFAALGAVSPTASSAEFQLLAALAVLQVAEPRIAYLATRQGTLFGVGLKLLLGYLLIGVSGGVTSSYYLILLVPVVAAATTMGGLGTFLVTLLASASYLSFLLFVDWNRYVIPAGEVRELCLRVLMLGILGYLAYNLVTATRAQARKYQAAAEQLAAANRNVQEAEAVVRRSERLAALGQLTAGLAHELRNPLGTMKASAEMLEKKVAGENEVARELAGYIATEVDRTNSLITRMLDLTRPLQLRLKDAEIVEMIDRAVARFQQRRPPFDVTVYKNYSPDIKPFPLDAELMERAVCNLLENAAQASPAGGAITVKTRPIAGGVEIAVIDRGSGIDATHLESVFNPFFTTKPNGVGLGLAIVSRIVDEHGGKMAVESEPGQGSVFRVLLPGGQSR